MTSDTRAGSAPPAPSTADLKTLPMPEVQKQLASSPDGLTQSEATKRLTQYGPNEITEHQTNPLLQFLSYFWGTDSVDDRGGGDPLGCGRSLA